MRAVRLSRFDFEWRHRRDKSVIYSALQYRFLIKSSTCHFLFTIGAFLRAVLHVNNLMILADLSEELFAAGLRSN